MLVNFTFKNFRSFRDEKTLSMEATSIKELKESVTQKGTYKLLPAAVMYGANSVGRAMFCLLFCHAQHRFRLCKIESKG